MRWQFSSQGNDMPDITPAAGAPPPNVPFERGGQWWVYNLEQQLMRWNAETNAWERVEPPTPEEQGS